VGVLDSMRYAMITRETGAVLVEGISSGSLPVMNG
jgi:hypothetical protein